VKQTHLELYFL